MTSQVIVSLISLFLLILLIRTFRLSSNFLFPDFFGFVINPQVICANICGMNVNNILSQIFYYENTALNGFTMFENYMNGFQVYGPSFLTITPNVTIYISATD
jgi:hypothetical protein